VFPRHSVKQTYTLARIPSHQKVEAAISDAYMYDPIPRKVVSIWKNGSKSQNKEERPSKVNQMAPHFKHDGNR
jgi:hypothetical protein